jgi:hypothetical protein
MPHWEKGHMGQFSVEIIRPLEWAPAGGQVLSRRFDRLPGELILKLFRAEIAEG